MPQNELLDTPVILQEFTIYFSPNELHGKYQADIFLFIISGDDVGSFDIAQSAFFEFGPDPVIMNKSNALVYTGDGSDLELGTYVVTLNANPYLTPPFPVVNFTINVTEGKSNFNKANGSLL